MHHFDAPLEIVSKPSPELPPEFFARLAAFYAAQPQVATQVSPIWHGIRAHYTQGLLAALASRSWEVVAEALQSVSSGCQLFGLDYAADGTEAVYRGHWERAVIAAAYNLGVLDVWNPEQEQDESLNADLVLRVESALGVTLDHPGCGGIRGAAVHGRFIPTKLAEMACVVASLRRLPSWPAGPWLEIGAGTGWLCYLVQRLLGEYPPAYHILDLPEVAVLQAYQLACGGYADRIWLAGEPDPDWSGYGVRESGEPRIFIHGMRSLPDGLTFQLACNQNSLPEIPRPVAERYLREIAARLKPGGAFVSINHESRRGGQVPVRELLAGVAEWRLCSRAPFWQRAGYVEEVWTR